MKYSNLFFLLSFFLFYSCASNKDYSEVCECYTKSKGDNLDNKLNNCTESTLNHKVGKTELKKIVPILITNCLAYQSDFNNVLPFLFENPRPNLVSQKDSLITCVAKNIQRAENLSRLSEISIQENDTEKAMEYINESLALQNNVKYSYWIKSYLFQKKRDFPNAVKEIEKANKFANNEDEKFFNESIILSLKEEAKK